MTIAQLWTKIAVWIGTLSLAGIGAFVTWLWSVRKLNAEIREIKQRMDKIEHVQLIERLALLLLRRAECLDPNENWTTKAGWAAALNDNANLIDEVFLVLQRDDLLEHGGAGNYRIGYKTPILTRRRG